MPRAAHPVQAVVWRVTNRREVSRRFAPMTWSYTYKSFSHILHSTHTQFCIRGNNRFKEITFELLNAPGGDEKSMHDWEANATHPPDLKTK